MASPKQALAIAAVAVVAPVAVGGAALGGCLASPPASIATNCSSDVGTQLSSMVNGLPANSTVTLKAGGCYLVNSTVLISGTKGLTINGNGATLERTTPGAPNTADPLLELVQNTGLTLSNLKLTGAYNGSNGGAAYEGNYGLLMEADHTVSVSDITMSNVQGDFISLNQANPSGNDSSLNTAISITKSSFTNAGYHGLTVESVNGLTVSGNTFTGMATDAMDFEVDTYSTQFTNNAPQGLAQDNVMISDNTWSAFNNDWFASLQGQMPGVEQDNVTLTGNVINAPSPLVEVVGTNPYLTNYPYWNAGLTITNNHGLQPAISTHGAGSPGTQAAMQIQGVVGLTISGNTLALAQSNGPYLSVLQAFENQQMVITNNSFPGAYSILEPISGGNTTIAQCGNAWGVSATMTDGVCS